MSTELKKRLLRLLEEDEEFRYAVAGRLGMLEILKRLDENTAAIRDLQGQVAEHSMAIISLQRTVTAIGARWGILAEEAFREGMRGLVERIFGGRVRKWTVYDEEGLVHGRPSIVDVDLVVTDKEHVLVEIKSSVSRADVYELWRVARLYEKRTGVRPRLAVVSPFVDPRARETAEELEIEVYTGT